MEQVETKSGESASPNIGDFKVGNVYEIKHRLLIGFNGGMPKEREFLKLIGFSSTGNLVFEVGNKYEERGGDFHDITPLIAEENKHASEASYIALINEAAELLTRARDMYLLPSEKRVTSKEITAWLKRARG